MTKNLLGHLVPLLAVTMILMSTTTLAIEPIRYVQCPNSAISNTPVILQGKRFYKSDTGEYFPVKGIAYYPRPNAGDLAFVSSSIDFFVEAYRYLWEPDIANLQKLGVNTVRIYAVDPSQNHDAFMCALQAANIYVMVGLLADCEDCAIGRNEAPSCYPTSLKQRGQWIINEFSKYANTLAFSAGNEVTLYAREWGQVSINAACQKKFLRDMRSYVQDCSGVLNSILPRAVPIGMANWDYERALQALYFNCQTDPTDSLEIPEWYGLNTYQYCDPNQSPPVGFQQLLQDFASYNLPSAVILSEFGCRERGFPTVGDFEAQRTWGQVDLLYSPQYSEVFAGGVVFEYSAEKAVVDTSNQGQPWPYYNFMKLQYGVGYYSPVDCDHTTITCDYIPYPEFDFLTQQLAAVDVSFVPNMATDNLSQNGQVPQCPEGMPALSLFDWPTDDEPDLPCYAHATPPPTVSPTTAFPTMAPTTGEPTTLSPTVPGETRHPTSPPVVAPEEGVDGGQGNSSNDGVTIEVFPPASSSSSVALTSFPCLFMISSTLVATAVTMTILGM